jgi:hypothetical protein
LTKPKPFEWTLGSEALAEIVNLIPNTASVDRNLWVRIAHGIQGAGGDFDLFDAFSQRWEGGYDALETMRVWDTLPPSQSGGGLLRQEAEKADPSGFDLWKSEWEVKGIFDDGWWKTPGRGLQQRWQ